MADDKLAIEHPFITEDSVPLLHSQASRGKKIATGTIHWRQAAGGLALVIGLIVLFVGWYGISGTRDTAEQLTYLVSGGVVGLALVALAATFFIAHEHHADRLALAELQERLSVLETGLAGEFDALDGRLQSLDGGSADRGVTAVHLRGAR